MRRLIVALALLVITLALGFAQAARADWTRPRVGQQMYWQLQGDLPFDLPVPPGEFLPERYWPYYYFDLDGFDHGSPPGRQSSDFFYLNLAARTGTCYISAGTYENWRPDAGQFPRSVLGNNNGWPGEKWLDIRSTAVRDIMRARIENTCADAQAVEFDNQDGYTNSTGFPLTARDQLAYNIWLADTAHAVDKAAILKNDVDQVEALEPYYDAALNEQCAQYSECGVYDAFTDNYKAVWQVEYRTYRQAWCDAAYTGRRTLYFSNLDLDGTKWQHCTPEVPYDDGPAAAAPPEEVTPEPTDPPVIEQPPGPGTSPSPSPAPRPSPHRTKPCKGKRGKALKKCKRQQVKKKRSAAKHRKTKGPKAHI